MQDMLAASQHMLLLSPLMSVLLEPWEALNPHASCAFSGQRGDHARKHSLVG